MVPSTSVPKLSKMAAADDLSQTFQLTSPVTELAERSSEVAQCSENKEQDESSKESQLFNPSGEQNEQANVFCQKLSAVRWKKVLTLVVVVVDFFLINASLSLIGAFFTTKVYSYSYTYIAILICVTTDIIFMN